MQELGRHQIEQLRPGTQVARSCRTHVMFPPWPRSRACASARSSATAETSTAGDLPAAAGEPDGVRALAAAQVQGRPGRQGRRLGDQLRIRLAAPDPGPAAVLLVPHLRRADSAGVARGAGAPSWLSSPVGGAVPHIMAGEPAARDRRGRLCQRVSSSPAETMLLRTQRRSITRRNQGTHENHAAETPPKPRVVEAGAGERNDTGVNPDLGKEQAMTVDVARQVHRVGSCRWGTRSKRGTTASSSTGAGDPDGRGHGPVLDPG